jgi:thioredoxin-like negative regulator of GroEL
MSKKESKLLFCQVDIDKSEGVAKKYEVTSVPQVSIFHRGVQKGRLINATADQVAEKIKEIKRMINPDGMDLDDKDAK